jgi:hypothetical protein
VFSNATAAINGVYNLIITNGTCSSEADSIVLNVINTPDAPVITGDNVYCAGILSF